MYLQVVWFFLEMTGRIMKIMSFLVGDLKLLPNT